MPRRNMGAGLALVTVTSALLLSGCRDAHRGNPAKPSEEVSSTLSDGTQGGAPDVQKAMRDALAAYEGMWASFVAAARTADPDSAQLPRYASGDALRQIVTALYADRDQGKVMLGNVEVHPSVIGVEPIDAPATVTIVDCVDDSNWLGYHKDGGLWDNQPRGKHHTTATVVRAGAVWTVNAFELEEPGQC